MSEEYTYYQLRKKNADDYSIEIEYESSVLELIFDHILENEFDISLYDLIELHTTEKNINDIIPLKKLKKGKNYEKIRNNKF